MTETLIAGGGLAGATTACLLAQAGRPVLLAERTSGPTDKICGEFLSAEATHYLGRLGLHPATLGAQRITTLRLAHRHASVAVPLPFAAHGLSRRLLDEALLHRAQTLGATILRGETVKLRETHPPVAELSTHGEIRPKTLFLATGKHDLRALRRPPQPHQTLVGFKQHFRLTPAQTTALAATVELVLLAEGYAGLQLVEDGIANLCLLVPAARLARAGGAWETLLPDLMESEPHLRTRLAGAVPLAAAISIARVPYGFVHRPGPADPPGIIRLGDQLAVIPSFTGDGMSIALHTAFVAANAHLAGQTPSAIHATLAPPLRRQIGRATLLNRAIAAAPARTAMLSLAALCPPAIRLAARLTRIPRVHFATT